MVEEREAVDIFQKGFAVTPETNPMIMDQCVQHLKNQSVSIAEMLKPLKEKLKDPNDQFAQRVLLERWRELVKNKPVRIHGGGKHRYIALRIQTPDYIMLLQRLTPGKDTGAEVHDSGVEVFLPLTDGIKFIVDDEERTLDALEDIVVVKPGQVHHLISPKTGQPSRTLIIGGFGFGRGRKVETK